MSISTEKKKIIVLPPRKLWDSAPPTPRLLRAGKQEKIIVVVGPTASGKSDLAIRLAKRFNGEIISADSRQVYRGMDVGTGKVRRDKTFPAQVKSLKLKIKNSTDYGLRTTDFFSEGIRHHLLDVASPKKTFTVDEYVRLAKKAIADIASRGKLPIVCGGTGLYIDALIYDIPLPHVPPDKKLRAKLEKQSAEQLFARLKKLDPVRAKTIDRYNPRRLIRALEIVLATGRPVPPAATDFSSLEPQFDVLWLGITRSRGILQKRIKTRLDARLRQGMLAEVKRLYSQGVSWKRLENFGLEYRRVAEFLQRKFKVKSSKLKIGNKKSTDYRLQTTDFSLMREALLRDIIRYSKRQTTWWKRNRNIRWVSGAGEAKNLATNFVRTFKH